MLPVLILQFAPSVPPGYFASRLARLGVRSRVVRVDAGEAVPEDLNGISGIGLMGGPMSANDDPPWIASVLALVRRAVQPAGRILAETPERLVRLHRLEDALYARWTEGRVTRPALPLFASVP